MQEWPSWQASCDVVVTAGPSDLEVSAPAAEPAVGDPNGAAGMTPPTQAAAELARQSAGEEAPAPSLGASEESAEADRAAAEGDGELKAADLRALTVKDFTEAMKQACSSFPLAPCSPLRSLLNLV